MKVYIDADERYPTIWASVANEEEEEYNKWKELYELPEHLFTALANAHEALDIIEGQVLDERIQLRTLDYNRK
jgi:hypothetical protein